MLAPIAHRRSYRHEAWIGRLVGLRFCFRRALRAQFFHHLLREDRRQLLFILAGAYSIAKPVGPATHAFLQFVEMLRDGAFDRSEVRQI